MTVKENVSPKLDEHDAYHMLRHDLCCSEGEACGLLMDAERQGWTNLLGKGPDFSVSVCYRSGKYRVVTFMEQHAHFYVFRVAKGTGGLTVWVEYFSPSGRFHTVIPTLFAHKREAVAWYRKMYPSAIVDTLVHDMYDHDIRAARVYARM